MSLISNMKYGIKITLKQTNEIHTRVMFKYFEPCNILDQYCICVVCSLPNTFCKSW